MYRKVALVTVSRTFPLYFLCLFLPREGKQAHFSGSSGYRLRTDRSSTRVELELILTTLN